MKRLSRINVALIAAILLAATATQAQQLHWQVDAQGFFDNVEGNDAYRDDITHMGMRLAPQLSIRSANQRHTLTAGYDALLEPGMKDVFTGGTAIAYYQYEHHGLRFLFGAYPRRLMHEQLSDYIVCDSLRRYRPNITGFDFLYTTPKGHVEVYLDWTAKQQTEVREQFMVGLNARYQPGLLQMGLEGYGYHYALKLHGSDYGQRIHDYFIAHPYVGLRTNQLGPLSLLDVRAGLLVGADRDRADSQWHCPVGFVGDVRAQWLGLILNQTVYAGKRQQHFGNQAFGEYYWGETFVRSSWWSHTDLAYEILHDHDLSVRAGLVFNFTDKGLNWHQMLTLSYAIGGKLFGK